MRAGAVVATVVTALSTAVVVTVSTGGKDAD